ncbi:CynX/NimT family MFS transporter [Streptomyces spectabilis]|uniref:MFS transporter n=3 Tax=Streptomyces spectabilis TaxID=68270 RepID=A0A5P2X5C7_STRST|nr:MFS transporter [Streptomyces spectabilis]MBB5101507.1 CP family cyanate transporter-like MFS transporter [Streptomyces spectabilis]MCI3900697.1 MFS transporter [Streptomyces spectabilis]QEV58240.1 MFS transporter [Streptomyces spectabilis]GGV11844.1 MFS transporter [Streptomyces spectabilis]
MRREAPAATATVARDDDTIDTAPGQAPHGPHGVTGRRALYLGLGVVLLALNLRPALVAVSPLADVIRDDSGMSATATSLLTALPLLCFGLLAPVAPGLGRRFGMERSLFGTMALICAGTALRMLDSVVALFAGTVVIGAGIAVANVLLPGLIKRDFPGRAGLMTGLYSMSLFGGAALAAGVTLPVRDASGMDWRTTLACWGALAVLALVVWLPQVRSRTRVGAAAARQAAHPVRGLWRSPLAWQVTAYMGLQSLNYYAAAAWLPTLLQDSGMSAGDAGWMLSFSALLGITGSFVTPVVVGGRLSAARLATLGAVLCAAGYAGLLAAPVGGAYVWMSLLGLGQGAAISLALLFLVQRAPDARHVAQLSSMAQCFGYVLAATGPAILGAVHDVSHDWTIPVVVLLVLLVPQVVVGLGAARDGHVRGTA